MHITEHTHQFPTPIDHMNFIELDQLRASLKLSQAQLCRRADISQTTYGRWKKYVRGELDGRQPQKRLLRAVRDALKVEVLERGVALVPSPSCSRRVS